MKQLIAAKTSASFPEANVVLTADEEQITPNIKLANIVRAAKLGRTRKDAQIDCCGAFAAALYDALRKRGIACAMVTASWESAAGSVGWYHAVVQVGKTYYDSLGEFSEAAYRQRTKVHPSVRSRIRYRRDVRRDAFEPDHAEMYAWYLRKLNAAFDDAGIVSLPET